MQFDEFNKDKRAAERNTECFKTIFIETVFEDSDGRWADVKEELQAAAEEAGVDLVERTEDDAEILAAYDTFQQEKELRAIRSSLSVFTYNKDDYGKDDSKSTSPTLRARELNDHEIDRAMLETPSKIKKTKKLPKQEYKASSASAAPRGNHVRCALPLNLFFRYTDDQSFGYNSPNLMRAGLYRDIEMEVPEPPEIGDTAFDVHAANHLNRKKIPTPMISVSNSLMWVLRKANLSRKWANATNGRIAVIDPRYLKKTYHVSDFIKGLCKRQPMIPAAHRYGGHYDILVWAEIPSNAIVNTIDYIELLRAATIPRHIHTHFRLDIVCRQNMKSLMYGIKFAVACDEEYEQAVHDFARIVLGSGANDDLTERFVDNVSID
ncbi:hypothetical protein ABW19_dt0208583 [Dactylella cylindrospora]|nr:hypothetical protein ABW19_dt0208583 [Dactylella cylindrospora]